MGLVGDGDVLISIDNRSVDSVGTLLRILNGDAIGRTLRLVFLRNGRLIERVVRPTIRPQRTSRPRRSAA